MRPAIDVVTLIEMVNTIVDQEEKSSNILADKNVFDKLLVKSLKQMSENKPDLFSSLCEDPSHKTLVVKKLMITF